MRPTHSCTAQKKKKKSLKNTCEYLLKNIKTELSGPGDDAALARLVPSQDEVGRGQHLSLSQPGFGFFVAGEEGDNGARQAAVGRDPPAGWDPSENHLLHLLAKILSRHNFCFYLLKFFFGSYRNTALL